MEAKIDKRKKYYVVLDTETCNTLMSKDGKLDMSNSLVYDLGYQIIDKKGNVYLQRSCVIWDVFYNMADVMKSAYYAEKIPLYIKDIYAGKRIVYSWYEVKRMLRQDMEAYNTNIVIAHNARFDYNAMNVTQRYLTKSAYRYFLPYGTEVWDSLKMARDVINKMPSYSAFCKNNGFVTKRGLNRLTAEVLYRYISHDTSFIEAHTGLEDVEIEAKIFAYIMRQHKKMRKKLFEDKVLVTN